MVLLVALQVPNITLNSYAWQTPAAASETVRSEAREGQRKLSMERMQKFSIYSPPKTGAKISMERMRKCARYEAERIGIMSVLSPPGDAVSVGDRELLENSDDVSSLGSR